jgi:hypothetical protein
MAAIFDLPGERREPPENWHHQSLDALARARCPVDGAKLLPETINYTYGFASCSECGRPVDFNEHRFVTKAELERQKKAAEKRARRPAR